MFKYVLLIATALAAVVELIRGVMAIIWAYRDDHATLLTRGWVVTFNGLILVGFAIGEYLWLF